MGLNEPVRAAGGVVVRDRDGHREVLVVHRPRYDDWTLPKGKAKAGETDEKCALREVEEETGLRCALGPELRRISYTDSRGRHKSVRYWRMTPLDGAFAPGPEVDEASWLPWEEASRILTYDRDRSVLESAALPDELPRV